MSNHNQPAEQPKLTYEAAGNAIVNLARTVMKAIVRDDQYEVAAVPHPDAADHRNE